MTGQKAITKALRYTSSVHLTHDGTTYQVEEVAGEHRIVANGRRHPVDGEVKEVPEPGQGVFFYEDWRDWTRAKVTLKGDNVNIIGRGQMPYNTWLIEW